MSFHLHKHNYYFAKTKYTKNINSVEYPAVIRGYSPDGTWLGSQVMILVVVVSFAKK